VIAVNRKTLPIAGVKANIKVDLHRSLFFAKRKQNKPFLALQRMTNFKCRTLKFSHLKLVFYNLPPIFAKIFELWKKQKNQPECIGCCSFYLQLYFFTYVCTMVIYCQPPFLLCASFW
jgi:hypothetical protein